MNNNLNKESRISDMLKLKKIRLIYSSRAQREKFVKKASSPQVKKKTHSSVEKKKLKLSIQLPRYETDYSRENLNTDLVFVSPNFSKFFKKKRIIFKSDLEKIYKNFGKIKF